MTTTLCLLATISVAQVPYDDAFAAAWKKNRELRVSIEVAKEVGHYPQELLDDLFSYYREGAGDEQVTKTVSREWVLRLYRTMFGVDNESQKDALNRALSNEQRLRRYLSEDSVVLFRTQLVGMLKTSREDLSPPSVISKHGDDTPNRLVRIAARQRRVLIHFCGWVLVSVPKILQTYVDDENEADDVRDAAKLAIVRISRGRVDR